MTAARRPPLPPATVDWIRRTRRHPRPTQPDFLVLRRLVQHLTVALGALPAGAKVLDVFCGTRPYEDLLPPGARVTGFDVDDHYGCADVTSPDFLPFEDEAFDAVVFTEGFFYLPNPASGAAELCRVVRPGGRLVLTVPVVWEYRSDRLEHRFTGPELASVFAGAWESVEVVEVGGYAVSWALLTGRLLRAVHEALEPQIRPRGAARPVFAASCVMMNAAAVLFDRFERLVWRPAPYALPPDLLLIARKKG